MRIVLEATCGLCGKRQHVTPEVLTSEDPGKRIGAIRCSNCNNKLDDSEHLRALGGFLSAVTNKRRHVAPAFHAAKILMTVMERHYPWRLGIRVLPEVKRRIQHSLAQASTEGVEERQVLPKRLGEV